MMPQKLAIVMNEKDNTATAVEAIEAGAAVAVSVAGQEIEVTVRQKIPFGHKFALRLIDPGSPIIKYGETIGYATKPIADGEHVHVHNLESGRGRGDK